MSPVTLPYGTWPSPITPAKMAESGARLGLPEVLADGSIAFVEHRPGEQGRAVVCAIAPDGEARDLSPAGTDARSSVHEYGGKSHGFEGDGALFFQCRRSKALHWGGRVVARGDEELRAAEPCFDGQRDRLLVVAERKTAAGHVDEIAALHRDGRSETLATGRDFYAHLVLSPDGTRLAYLGWDHPTMAWDAAYVCTREVLAGGALGPEEVLGGGPQGSAFGPCFSPRGELFCALELADRWQICSLDAEGPPEPIVAIDLELGAPLWQLGTRLFGFADEDTIVAAGFVGGRSQVVEIDVRGRTSRVLLADEPHVGELAVRGDTVAFLRGWAGHATQLVRLSRSSGAIDVVRDTSLVTSAWLPMAQPVTAPTPTGPVHANLFLPRSPSHRGPEGELPPVVVMMHGGPTGCANAVPSPLSAFFTSRGFAVLDVNYRGSTGFGRAYREALRGKWGELDVSDAAEVVKSLSDVVDTERAVIRGGSAGGFTVLQALCDHDLFRAGVCWYGPSDPATFMDQTHKLERHYEEFLFGDASVRGQNVARRRPIAKAARVTAPIAFFQGGKDPAVVPEQTLRMHEALLALGKDSEHHLYPNEGHGFRASEVIGDVFEKELAFYRRVLGL